jgi:hypothetical protein
MQYLFIILSFFSYTLGYAQVTYMKAPEERIEPVEFHSLAEDDSLGLISIYEFGQQITSCDCNFQNLLRNWTDQFVSNLEDIRLDSCKYIGIIEDSIMLNRYAKKLTDKNVLRYRIVERHDTTTNSVNNPNSLFYRNRFGGYRSFHAGTTQENVKQIMKKDITPSEINELYLLPWRATFPQKVHIGDHVYMITMKIEGKKYHNYAICNSQNHRVVWDNLFNFKVPISKITLKD